jgi:HlyD family secretion protein
MQFRENIKLDNITFTYPNKEIPAVKDLTIEIPLNSTVGLVGSSGSGKSTTIDILLGLINPQVGHLKIDNQVVTDTNRKIWQIKIGYVPQSIYLTEGSISENIAFGIPENEIDSDKIHNAIRLAHLEEMVSELPAGIATKVGERGIQLSGGQRQRIGIARALYNNAEILLFDEATSALDGITEQIIMKAIQELTGSKTIIIVAHRLKTVAKCDVIYMLENGQLVDQGTYDDLFSRNLQFRQMANNA